MDVAQQVERTDRTLGSGLEAGLDAGRVEEVEAEEGGNLFTLAHVVVADGALPGLAVVLALQQVVPVLFDGVGVYALGVDPEVDDAFLDDHAALSLVHWVLAEEAGDVVAVALVVFELKL